MNVDSRMLTALVLASACAAPLFACHPAHAADAARVVSPTLDLSIEDRAPGGKAETASFSLSMIDGHAELKTSARDVKYYFKAQSQDRANKSIGLVVRRSGPAPTHDVDVESAVTFPAEAPVLVAKIERADGHITSVSARVR